MYERFVKPQALPSLAKPHLAKYRLLPGLAQPWNGGGSLYPRVRLVTDSLPPNVEGAI